MVREKNSQPAKTKNSVDGEHNRVVRIGLQGGSKEGTKEELLAATLCIRPSNEWNLTMMPKVKYDFLIYSASLFKAS